MQRVKLALVHQSNRMSRWAVASSIASALVLGSSLAAALTQPDGTPIPTGNGLQGMFDGRGEAIDALNNAATTPETFVPGCDLTFEVLQRNAGYQNSFGWYNVTGGKPADSDLHEFLTCTDAVGTVKVLSIRSDPAYAGGEVGFYEATGGCATLSNHDYLFYSEKQYNPDGTQANPYVHLLIYNSVTVPNAFYFGWEDLLSGGDNDFDDLTTFVTGITCSGGGGVCDTGNPGVCADGVQQCQSGQLACVQLEQPSAEVCDGLDNDCNGTVDEGDLCPATLVCDRGVCVPKCGGGEFQCPTGLVCDANNLCVDPKCVDVDCPSGEICVGGACQGACDGVACPHGQQCRLGRCVDPCEGLSCDGDQVCVDGVCTARCQCTGCGAGAACQAAGVCVPDACVGVDCQAGTWCATDGTCQDSCDGAACPAGSTCESGQCVEAAGDAGTDSGSGGSGGNPLQDASAMDGGAGHGDGAVPGTDGSTNDLAQGDATGDESSCACRIGQARRSNGAWLLALLGLSAAWLGRRGRLPGGHGAKASPRAEKNRNRDASTSGMPLR